MAPHSIVYDFTTYLQVLNIWGCRSYLMVTNLLGIIEIIRRFQCTKEIKNQD